MNYKAIELPNGTFAVKKGRAKKDGSLTYLTKSVTDDLEEAEAYAAYLNAEEALKKAARIISTVSLQQAKDIAYSANELIDIVVERLENEDPEFSELDPKGFLA